MVGLDFSNKNVVITGGNGGIGTPVVRGVLEGGGNVILTARRNIDDFTSALNEEFGEGRVILSLCTEALSRRKLQMWSFSTHRILQVSAPARSPMPMAVSYSTAEPENRS